MEEVPDDEGLFLPPPSFRTHFRVQSPCSLLTRALGAEGRVDFPTVTEICEGIEGDSDELAAVARLLSAALQAKDSSLSSQLKALTVVHELLYDADARQALCTTPGLRAAVAHLRKRHLREASFTAEGDALRLCSGPAEECVRLLTSEICRTLDVTICRL